jgi:hypothetical protein
MHPSIIIEKTRFQPNFRRFLGQAHHRTCVGISLCLSDAAPFSANGRVGTVILAYGDRDDGCREDKECDHLENGSWD